MAMAEPALRESQVVLGTFRVGETLYAIDVACLREVVRTAEPTPLPRAPRLIEGVVDLRGALVPVVDLGRALGAAPAQPGPRARIAVVEVDGLVLGLRVDEAVEVIRVEAGSLGDPPALSSRADRPLARTLLRRPDAAPVVVLSLEGLLEQIHRSDPEAGEA